MTGKNFLYALTRRQALQVRTTNDIECTATLLKTRHIPQAKLVPRHITSQQPKERRRWYPTHHLDAQGAPARQSGTHVTHE